MTKLLIGFFMTLGSIIGGYIPVLWGGSLMSYSSVLLGGIGGILGIIIGIKLSLFLSSN